MPMPGPPEQPSVSVILAVLDEANFIDGVLSDLLGQDYEGTLEVIVADGGSTDGTLARLEDWAARDRRLSVIANPERRQAPGLNLAAAKASGEFLVRADGHTRFASDYVRASVEVLEETGGAVGGRMFPVGRTSFGRAVAAAMKSPLTMGPGRFHHSTSREEVDTVYLGAMRREKFQALAGSALSLRHLRGRRLLLPLATARGQGLRRPLDQIRVHPRDRPADLWRQYFRYGMGKAEMLWRNGTLPSWRPLAPLTLVLGIVLLALVGLVTGVWVPLMVLAGLWLLLLIWVAIRADEPAPGVLFGGGDHAPQLWAR